MLRRTNHRLPSIVFAIALLCVAYGSLTVRQTEAARALPKNRTDFGLVYDGLRRGSAQTTCASMYIMEDGSCTHGPDPLLPGRDMRRAVLPLSPAQTAAFERVQSTTPGCSDPDALLDTRDNEKRVQVLYVRTADQPDHFAEFEDSIRHWAELADDVFNLSAQQTGGSLRVRFVRDGGCRIDVTSAVVPAGAADQFRMTTAALRAQGFDRVNRKYLLFVDSAVYCGIAQTKVDDRPGVMNLNNLGAMFARVDAPCWGARVAAHELMHTMGGVQDSAPNSTYGIEGSLGGHCTDGSDIMCYADASNAHTQMRTACPSSNRLRFDCNNDDYFHSKPAPGSYLATHYNAATNAFLIQDAAQLADPNAVTDAVLESVEISAPALRQLFVPFALSAAN
jgi:hypothetical protein